MFAALSVCAAIVLAAAAPGVALAAGDLSAAQDRVEAAQLAVRATALAHALADERDDLAVGAATGHAALSAADRARTDRAAGDVRGARLSADLRTALATLADVRTSALAAGSAQAAVAAYQPLADALGRATGPVTAPLGRATAAASVQRGLLVAGLETVGPQHTLVADAQAARLQEQAALAEFHATAPAHLRTGYDQTVTGSDTAAADHDLAQLLGGGELTLADRDLGAEHVDSALAARISLMRGVEASAAAGEAATAASHRDHEVTVLELRAALAVLCLILLIAVLVSLFRTLTRPLAALHRWSRADPDSGQGAEVIGADEFAAVARRVNALTQEDQALHSRARELADERTEAAAAHAALTTEHRALLRAGADLVRTRDDLLRSREEIAAQLGEATVRNAAQIVHVNLSLRTLGLVERQLALIESMEEHEQEPERLEKLFRLDHLATRMRRNSENLLVLTGTEHSHGATARPVPLIDVARAAISEVERYERVRVLAMPDAQVAGRAADDVSHLIAELLDNATAFSAPADEVHLSGWVLDGGEVMVSVEDSGIGVPADRLDGFNALLADPDPAPPGPVAGLGLYVVARLAHRHGVRVELRPRATGGTTAVTVLPRLLVPAIDPPAGVLPGPRDEMTAFPPQAVLPAQQVADGRPDPGEVRFPEQQMTGGLSLFPEFPVPDGRPADERLTDDRLADDRLADGRLTGGQRAGEPPGPGELPLTGRQSRVSRSDRQLPADAPPTEPRVRIERLDVWPAPVPPAPPVQVQPSPAEPAFAAEAVPAPPEDLYAPGPADFAAGPAMGPAAGDGAGPAADPYPGPEVDSQVGADPGPAAGQPAPPPRPGSAEHTRAGYSPRHAAAPAAIPPGAAPRAEPGRAPGGLLPRRVRQATGMRSEAFGGAPPPSAAPLDAEELRRKLAGLQQGLREGRRDAELETRGAAGTGTNPSAAAASPGDTVEEATR